ncbi:MAG: hypothetical protein K6E37_05075 [Bacteroidales bacterium]|nr:hypothetical protein [Bacteroidales bacterium]
MQRIVRRQLPDGSWRQVFPFHVSLEGLQTAVLCRDDVDYDAAVKILCVCAKRVNVIVIIYAVVSNHCHVAVLAGSQVLAYNYGLEVKRMLSMHYSFRYGKTRVMRSVDVQAIPLDNDGYVRNALAYIPRNALDNGCNINEYEWSGFRAMFSAKPVSGRPVASLTKREVESIMHTGDKLAGVRWLLDDDGRLIPGSWCDHQYLEQAFENDPAYFLRTIGGVNPAQMHELLIENPRIRMPDAEFVKYANEACQKWYKQDIMALSVDKKLRLASFLFRTTRTSVPQLSRALGLPREKTAAAIGKKYQAE